MQVRHASSHESNRPASGPGRKSQLPRTCITTFGLLAIFLGLVALPATRTTAWSPSKAGYKDILLGP